VIDGRVIRVIRAARQRRSGGHVASEAMRSGRSALSLTPLRCYYTAALWPVALSLRQNVDGLDE
jgi:hypothetical protein